MRNGWLSVLLASVLVFSLAGSDTPGSVSLALRQPGDDRPQWIWYPEGDATREAPVARRYFRRVFTIDRPTQIVVDEAELDIAADDAFTVWINGAPVGKGEGTKQTFHFDVRAHLVHGKNVIAVEVRNDKGPAGLVVRLGYVPNGQSKLAEVSNGSWKCSQSAEKDWQTAAFDDAKWPAVKVLGPIGQPNPWKHLAFGRGSERFKVPDGFVVQMVVPPRPAAAFEGKSPLLQGPHLSLVNLTFDNKGRLLVSREGGPRSPKGIKAGQILLCTNPDKNGVYQDYKIYCDQVLNSQGMCWVKDSLLLVGDGPQGTGLYRCRDTNHDDRVDEVKLLHKFKGNMGEHGPHAILHGPDGWLYLVIGNHAWAQVDQLADNSPLYRWPKGVEGPDQGRPNTTEDVLLPRMNDARGHAANRLAPGGTIWRLDLDGKHMSLVAAGFRNQYDAAFSPFNELFTFDSDMEWDENLPWYRAVSVCFCPPGAEFGWRTGASKIPRYAIDTLPPVAETGRGSPVGVEFYDHHAFPEKYRGAFFLADWAIGVIFAVHLKREGASFKADVERFCVGAPMNVTDLVVGPEGAIYFSLGGRGTQGGVFRIVNTKPDSPNAEPLPWLDQPQPLSAWGRAQTEVAARRVQDPVQQLAARAQDTACSPRQRVQALTMLQTHFSDRGAHPSADLLVKLSKDPDVDVRAAAVWLLGVKGYAAGRERLLEALKDQDAFVRRRACEALIRARIEPPVDLIWPLLADPDKFVRTAARLVVERMDSEKWVHLLFPCRDVPQALEGIVALCKNGSAQKYGDRLYEVLGNTRYSGTVQDALDMYRVLQLLLVHTTQRPERVRRMDQAIFKHGLLAEDPRVKREAAILLTYFRREKLTGLPVHQLLLEELLKTPNDRAQQIHYFYCLRLLAGESWTTAQKRQLLEWYDGTKTWVGGHSFHPYLENMLTQLLSIFTNEDKTWAISRGDKMPLAAAVLMRSTPDSQLPPMKELAEMYSRLHAAGKVPRGEELKGAILSKISAGSAEGRAALKRIADVDESQRPQVARALARNPEPADFPYLINGLNTPLPAAILELLAALKKLDRKPVTTPEAKPEDAAAFRAVILASGRLAANQRWQAVEVLRHWGNRRFTPTEGDWETELEAWSRWYAQTYPKAPALPNFKVIAGETRWNMDELLAYLEKDPRGRNGDVKAGRLLFEKTNCIKCHKFGSIGEGLGPDLTTVKSRFNRKDLLESVLYPSRVISDQYRGSVIQTKEGQLYTGLVAIQGDTVTVLQLDGTKVTLKKADIQDMVASTTSPMPDKLFETLTKEEIADLFAYLESPPPK